MIVATLFFVSLTACERVGTGRTQYIHSPKQDMKVTKTIASDLADGVCARIEIHNDLQLRLKIEMERPDHVTYWEDTEDYFNSAISLYVSRPKQDWCYTCDNSAYQDSSQYTVNYQLPVGSTAAAEIPHFLYEDYALSPGASASLERTQPGDTFSFEIPYDESKVIGGDRSQVSFSTQLGFNAFPIDIATGAPSEADYPAGFSLTSKILESSETDTAADCGYVYSVSWNSIK